MFGFATCRLAASLLLATIAWGRLEDRIAAARLADNVRISDGGGRPHSKNKTRVLLTAAGHLIEETEVLDKRMAEDESEREGLMRSQSSLLLQLEDLRSQKASLEGHLAPAQEAVMALQLLHQHFRDEDAASAETEAATVAKMTLDMDRSEKSLVKKLSGVEADIQRCEAELASVENSLESLNKSLETDRSSRDDLSSKRSKIDGFVKLDSYMRQQYNEIVKSLDGDAVKDLDA